MDSDCCETIAIRLKAALVETGCSGKGNLAMAIRITHPQTLFRGIPHLGAFSTDICVGCANAICVGGSIGYKVCIVYKGKKAENLVNIHQSGAV